MKLRALAAILFYGFSLAAAAEIKLVTVPYPPYYGPEMKNGGPISEIVVAAYQQAGHEVKIRFVPWVRALKDAKAGTADGLLGAWRTEEREQWFLFSDELPANELVFYKRRETPPETFSDFGELKSYRIGIVRGYANPEEFTAAKLTTQEFESDVLNLAALGRNKIDLVLVDKATARYLLATQLPGFVDELVALEPPVRIWPLYVAISRKTDDAQRKLADLNKGLRMIHSQGKIDWILKKHGFQ